MDSDVVAISGPAGLWRRGVARPDARVRLRGRRRSLGAWIAGGVAVLMLGDGAASLMLGPAARPAPIARPAPAVPPRPPAWLDIPNPLHLYGLSGSAFARLPLVYEARRRETGPERQDTLTYGAFDSTAPFLRLAFRRLGEPERGADLLVDLARLGATSGLAVTRLGLPLNLMTRFGLFDTADITLRRDEAALPCLGFHLVADGPVAMTGLACGSTAKPIDRASLGCVLDRIDLSSAGDDDALRDMFVAAERRRTGDCMPGRRRPGDAP